VLGGIVLLLSAIDDVGAAPRRADDVARGHRAAAGEVLVQFKGLPGGRGASLASDALADVERDEPVGHGRWHLVRSRSRSAEELASILRARADVDVAEPNYAVHIMGVPDDLSAPLWALQNTGQRLENGDVGTPGADLDATHAWDVTQGSRRVVVATVDTGVLQSHRDLVANLWTAPRAFTVTIGGQTLACAAGTHGFNAIARTCDPADDNGHGTHVAGSIGAVGNNASGVVGINWATSIMALKFMDAAGNGYISDVINAIEFALQVKATFASTGDADIRILNNSWSGGGFSQALSDEIAKAADAGILFVTSAGNTGLDHEITPVYPSDYAGANVLSVAATDYRDRLGTFSDFGAQRVHVAAPGVLIYSTTLSQTDPTGSYGTLSGTSMAAAYASGIASLVLSHCPYSTGALRDALVRTAVPLSALSAKTASGARLNAATAVRSCDNAAGPLDSVVHAADVAATDRHGAWTLQSDPTAADGVALASADAGWSSTDVPLAQPRDYVDVRVPANAGVAYHVWLRLKAGADSKWNDSVWLQFSDARVNGAAVYGINSTTGLAVNLERCSNCGVAGWGWQDGVYWMATPLLTFGSTGPQTIRIQTREDGVAFDQVVLSASAWASTAPGQVMGDSTIVPRTPGGTSTGTTGTTGTSGTTGSGTASSQPFSGTPALLPGTVQAEDFDAGGEGVGYHDMDAANNGGAYRATGVDIEATTGGGQNIGWVAPGEWLAYTVNISAAGAYTAQFRVASNGPGGTFHLDVGGVDVSGPITIPNTGWWQAWQTISRSVTLPAGRQVLKLVMEGTGSNAVGNIDWFAVVSAQPSTALPGRIVAANFDEGGEGVAYHDASAGNSGGAFRSTDVDLEACAEGGYDVGWTDAGEWLRYSVTVAAAGSYVMRFRVASPDGSGRLHVAIGSTTIASGIVVPRTGGWQTWTTIGVPVMLQAGPQTITLGIDAPGFNVSYIDVMAE
jgi:subtilisin family serine protease